MCYLIRCFDVICNRDTLPVRVVLEQEQVKPIVSDFKMANDQAKAILLSLVPHSVELLSSKFSIDNCFMREEDSLLMLAAAFPHGYERRERIHGFVENVIPKYSDEDFRRHFRLGRTTVEILLQQFGEILRKQPSDVGRPSCSLEKTVLLPIWTLANQESFRLVADRFNVGEGHAHSIFTSFCDAISQKANLFISWPEGQDMLDNIKDFECLRAQAFPGVVGCVDGSFIAIKGRKCDNQSYHTRKGFRAIILQGICDAKQRFIDVFVGWPGSSHDGRVWRNSTIAKRLEANPGSLIPPNKHILGDSAYPLTSHLLTPFKDNGHLTPAQRYYNKKLSSSRVVIENAFGLLKSRFRRLRYLDMIRLDRASKVVLVACALHNICIAQSDFLENDVIPNDVDFNSNHNEAQNQVGMAKRNHIAQMLYNDK